MSYAAIKPEYYRMFQPDSPWHAGSEGWSTAPWPGWGRNPNLVGPQRLAVEGLGAYYAPEYEKPINGLGGGCGCKGVGDATTPIDPVLVVPASSATPPLVQTAPAATLTPPTVADAAAAARSPDPGSAGGHRG